MGQIDFNQFKQNLQNKPNNNSTTNGKPRVGFFSLKNDKDFAIVRFMIDSPADFDIVAGHRMTVGGFSRMVSCIRDAHEPVENCPLCAAGKKLEYKFYIHLIQYVRDANGNLVPVPKVWERSTIYVDTFNNYLADYGPLSDCLFKVTRNGVAGSTKTTYDINFIPSTNPVYSPEIYVKDTSLFEGYKAVGNAVINYDANKMVELLEGTQDAEEVTPRFTPNPGNSKSQLQSSNSSSPLTYTSSYDVNTTPSYEAPQSPVAPQAPQYNTARRFVPPADSTNAVNVPNRPTRVY